jgi:hypothetical protein
MGSKQISMDMLASPLLLCGYCCMATKNRAGGAFCWASQVLYKENMTQREFKREQYHQTEEEETV